ncbi:Ribonuclease [Actinidia chinensis var. chinensis]|uniref:Ribonuclease n=1 Tax=Actinidia chinensis var. chinensis TaxID=1590841 RepID=A0A2R6PEI6_ACTCC|nr:Ribonuclease [Actinidia chinensis var. chinensis]
MDYFKKAVEQRKNFDLLRVLNDSEIVPSDSEFYNVTRIESAVQKKIRTDNHMHMSCRKIGQEIMLREIFICLDDMARDYVSCPVKKKDQYCGMDEPPEKIKIPPFPETHQGQPGPKGCFYYYISIVATALCVSVSLLYFCRCYGR